MLRKVEEKGDGRMIEKEGVWVVGLSMVEREAVVAHEGAARRRSADEILGMGMHRAYWSTHCYSFDLYQYNYSSNFNYLNPKGRHFVRQRGSQMIVPFKDWSI